MVLPTEIIIKEEKEDFEFDAYEEPSCEIELKVEKIEENPQTEINFNNYQYCDRPDFGIVDYDELTEYSLEKCKFCKEMFLDSYSLLCHNLKHVILNLIPIDKQKYQYLHCLQTFNDQTKLDNHLKDNSQKNELLLVCKSRLKKSESFQSCHICSKVFRYKIWHEHLRQVHGDAMFQCDLCHKKFKAKRYLRRHISYVHLRLMRNGPNKKIRTEDVQCSQCPAVFKHKTSLHLHVKNCHCEKVQCHKCLSILKKSNLPNHMRRVHYNDGKVHKCDCGKTFKSPRYLKIHVKNSHNKKSK